MEFLFHPAEEEMDKEIANVSRCMLCGTDHSSSECPNTVRACQYCGGVGSHQAYCFLRISKPCVYCGIYHSAVPECALKWSEQFPEASAVPKEEIKSLDQEIEEMCKLCKARPVIINGMCNYCNDMVQHHTLEMHVVCQECGLSPPIARGLCVDCSPPGFTHGNALEESSNQQTPFHIWNACNNTRYDDTYWQSSLSEENKNNWDQESVGSCDWIVISSDED